MITKATLEDVSNLNSHSLKRAIFNSHKNKDIIFRQEVEQFIETKKEFAL